MTQKILIDKTEGIVPPIDAKQPNIAYFILVHRFPEQFKRMFKSIYDPANHYLIHIDKKTSLDIRQSIEAFLSDYANAYVMNSKNVLWGGYSMVQAELDGMKFLLSKNINWDFFINLSGQDFPLKSQAFIRDYLGKHLGVNFLKTVNQAELRPETMNRIENYYDETDEGYTGTPYKRAFMGNVTSYIGGQWMILTRACCEFICCSKEIKRFEDFYRHTFIADESFFQTVLMNTSFGEKIVNDDKRSIIWIADGSIKLRPKTLDIADLVFLLSGNSLFARKFDEVVDSLVLESLESMISTCEIQPEVCYTD